MLSAAQTKDFQNFANSFGSGYLKEHKAHDMLVTLHDLPAISADADRFSRFLESSLLMEGFSAKDIPAIQAWLVENN